MVAAATPPKGDETMDTPTTGQIKHEIENRMKGGMAQAAERGLETPANFPELMEAGARKLATTLSYTGDVDELAQWAGNLARSLMAPADAATPATDDAQPTAIEAQASVTLHPTTDDAFQHAVYDTHTLRVTTAHAASSYGQPVVLRQDGTLVDYAAIETIHLLGSTAAQAAAVAQALDPFGIRVTWQARRGHPDEA
jgi:hypothetical protein